MADTHEPRRGRDAAQPSDIPARGWLDIAWRVKDQLNEDNASLIAAGVGLFAMLAAFPALFAMVSIYGLVTTPSLVVDHLQVVAGIVPEDALELFRSHLTSIADRQDDTLGYGIVAGLALAIWSARKGMVAVMQACNVAYDESEERGFFRQIIESLAFTVGAIVYFIVVLAVGVALPLVLEALFEEGWLLDTLTIVRWPLLWVFVVVALAVVYRYGPSRRSAKWRWVTWGSAIAAALRVLGSVAFALYVRTFGSYGETYGALGGVVILLLWLYLSGFVVVLGAEINSEIEHQTARDSTVGPPRPMGQRGAYVADTVGELRGSEG